jgi:type I restriction-modification system DNA methylase subunit
VSQATGHLSQQELESYLWGAANLLRGLIDAGDYKQYVFPLLFFKRLSDVWDEEYAAALADTGDEGYARATANDRFRIPEDAHWADVRSASRDVGRVLITAFRAIEAANPKRLTGIFGNASWTDKAQMPDETLKNHRALLAALTGPESRTRRRARQRLRVSDQTVRRRQRSHRAGVLHEPHAGASDDADARAEAR